MFVLNQHHNMKESPPEGAPSGARMNREVLTLQKAKSPR